MTLFTFGHSNHSLDKLLGLLKGHGVVTVVDVRTAPYSRFHPQFNRKSLESALLQRDITYVYAGQQLGGRPSDPTCYKSRTRPRKGADYPSELDYAEVTKRLWFIQGIEQLLELAHGRTTAIMCSEEDPSRCHRHHLIAQYLAAQHPDVDVQHIRGDGSVSSARLLMVSAEAQSVEQLRLESHDTLDEREGT